MHASSLTGRRNWPRYVSATMWRGLRSSAPQPAAPDFDPETSDADFLVEFLPDSDRSSFDRFFGLVEELRHILGRPVDLVENHEFRNPYLRAAIDSSRELVYAS